MRTRTFESILSLEGTSYAMKSLVPKPKTELLTSPIPQIVSKKLLQLGPRSWADGHEGGFVSRL